MHIENNHDEIPIYIYMYYVYALAIATAYALATALAPPCVCIRVCNPDVLHMRHRQPVHVHIKE